MNKVKCILDTDIGDDIDDAFALSLLLNEERAELLGVTTVFRNALQRAKMARYLARSYGKDIKVYPGIDDPIQAKIEDLIPPEIKKKERLDEQGKYYLPQYLPEMDEMEVETKSAIDYIIETIHQYPHEVVLFAIGPLTNIATAIKKDPTISPLIKEIRMMGGEPTSLTTKEWNIFCDPEAAYVVFSSEAKLTMVGLNVTMKCQLIDVYRQKLLQVKGRQYELLSSMMKKWFDHYAFSMPVMHDPLAVSSYFTPCLTFEEKKIIVGTLGEKRAVTYEDENGKEVTVAIAVDTENFFPYFLSTIFKTERSLS